MNGLLPDAVREILQGKSVNGASESFGIVTLVLLVVVLLEREALRAARGRSTVALTAVAVPLVLVVLGTLLARVLLVID